MSERAEEMKREDMAAPKISVITVVYNGALEVEETLKSVLGQTYPQLEYIVIDGGSTDGTVDIIRRFEKNIDVFSSEPDKGIYDAMNKGLARATGDWVVFMNAGDRFYKDTTVSDVFAAPHFDAQVIYGGVEIRYDDFARIEAPGRPDQLWQGMKFSHQSAFISAPYHKERPYNIANRIAADLQFFYQAYVDGARFVRSGEVIASVNTGGVSETNRQRAIGAALKAVTDVRDTPSVRLYFALRMADASLRSFLKRILPKNIVKWIILRK